MLDLPHRLVTLMIQKKESYNIILQIAQKIEVQSIILPVVADSSSWKHGIPVITQLKLVSNGLRETVSKGRCFIGKAVRKFESLQAFPDFLGTSHLQ